SDAAVDLGKAENNVGIIAADVGSLNFNNAGDLTVGVVDGVEGISTEGPVSLKTGGDLSIEEAIAIAGGEPGDIITLEVGGTAEQSGGATLSAHGLVLLDGDYDLSDPGTSIDVIASRAGKVAFRNDGDLKDGTLTATRAGGTTEEI